MDATDTAQQESIDILKGKVEELLAVQANLTRDLALVDAREAAAEAATTTEVNTFYLLWAGALVFLMQAGFAVLSAGSIRTKNVKNILLKNLLDACMGARNLRPECNQSRAQNLTRAPRARSAQAPSAGTPSATASRTRATTTRTRSSAAANAYWNHHVM